jgi:glutathione S-transferase
MMEAAMKLVIGTRKWSTWSLRPWLVLKRADVAFDEVLVTLRETGTAEALKPYSASSQCPVLIDGDLTVWDSLAICEYLGEQDPARWPADPKARAVARSVCAQIHSGFQSLRGECSMDLSLAPYTLELTPATQGDVDKLVRVFEEVHGRYGAGGPFLLGQWSIADAFWTPVATRFRTFGIQAPALAAYHELLLAQPEFLEWERLAVT